MEFTVPVTVTRPVPFPVDDAFDWLTDYRDDDADRTDAVIDDRRVVEEDEDRIVLEGVTTVLGRQAEGRAVVTLDPPEGPASSARWVSEIVDGPGSGSLYEYELEPDGDRSLLTVTYNIPVGGILDRVKFWFVEDDVQEELEEMWDGFVETMEEELAAGEAAEAEA